jgi:hypothetical protein
MLMTVPIKILYFNDHCVCRSLRFVRGEVCWRRGLLEERFVGGEVFVRGEVC